MPITRRQFVLGGLGAGVAGAAGLSLARDPRKPAAPVRRRRRTHGRRRRRPPRRSRTASSSC